MKYLVALFIFSSILLISCQVAPPPEPPSEPPPVIVSIGDSITMGIQDAGLIIDYQLKSYPYLIAKQMGASNSFRQPYVRLPGIGVYPYERPLSIIGNEIVATEWPDGILDVDTVIGRLASLFCPTPYNNLGVNGARLFEMRRTTTMENSLPAGNYFFDIVLRNITTPPLPNFGGTTVVQQAAMLQPDIILLWIGNNDILHTVLDGCGVNGNGFGGDDPPTSEEDFQSEYTNLLNDLKAVTNDIVMASIPSYLPYGYALDGIFVSGGLSVFDPQTFAPVLYDYGDGNDLPIPLLLEEADAKHLTLNGAIVYLEEGRGIPNQETLVTVMGYGADEAAAMIAAMELAGIVIPDLPSPLEGNFTITQTEEDQAKAIVDGYNLILSSLSESLDVPLVDITQSWWRNFPLDDDHPAFGGYSGAFVLQDRDNTIFSLDGVHLNNLGHALCANSFIEVLNQNYGLGIQPLNPDDYKGQYSVAELESASIKALKSVYDAYVPQSP